MRLTPDRQSRRGGIWNVKPWFHGEKTHAFEAIIQFHVHGQGTKLFGDGFAFWCATVCVACCL